MSKVTRVTVLCPNGRRQIVNLTPNSSILQILEEVCQKQKLNPDDFDIYHYKKALDLSLPIRFASIPNNAQLELQPAKVARKECHVSVALQLESGERIMKDFVPSTTVSDVIEQSLSTKPDISNMNQKGEPVCIYMRQKLIGDAIKNTTLKGLGLTTGSAIIRLMYRNPDDLSDQAHISTPLSKPVKKTTNECFDLSSPSTSKENVYDQPPQEQKVYSKFDNSSKSTVNTSSDNPSLSQKSLPISQNNKVKEDCQRKIEIDNYFDKLSSKPSRMSDTVSSDAKQMESEQITDQSMDVDAIGMDQVPPEEEIGAVHYIGGRHAVLYSLDDITDVKKADLPDEFFELTIEDARYLLEEFKRTRSELENQPLLTKELRNRQMLKKLGRFKSTVIRIYFPERLVLQAVFEAQETVQDVCDFIRQYLEDQSLKFYLYTAPPKEKKDVTKTLIESMLIPASVVYFGSDSPKPSYLMSSLKEKISDPRAASLAAYESRQQAMNDVEEEELSSEFNEEPITVIDEVIEEQKVPGPSSIQPSNLVQTSQKAPKWLKLSKK